VNTFGWQEVW